MRRIDSLTAEQTARMPEWRDRWIEIGLRTGPTTDEDRRRWEAAMAVWYRAADLTPPTEIVWVRNPIDGVREVARRTGRPATDAWMNRIGGQFWAGWWYGPAHQTFFVDVCGLDLESPLLERLRAHETTCETASWWWPYDTFVIVCERPQSIARDEAGRLHSLDGPSIAWAGWSLHHVHGTRVPAYVVEQPDQITVDAIHGESNAEVRRVMVERYGLSRYVRDAQFDVLDDDRDPLGQPRRLLRRGDLVIVELTNSTVDADGTRRVYHVPCHPELRPLLSTGELGSPQALTAQNAVASTYGLTGAEYQLQVET